MTRHRDDIVIHNALRDERDALKKENALLRSLLRLARTKLPAGNHRLVDRINEALKGGK